MYIALTNQGAVAKQAVDIFKLDLDDLIIRRWYITANMMDFQGKIGLGGDLDIKVGGRERGLGGTYDNNNKCGILESIQIHDW